MGRCLLRFADSKLVCLLFAAILGSWLGPGWLKTYENHLREREIALQERQWRYQIKKELLDKMDKAALACLLPLRDEGKFDETTMENLRLRQRDAIQLFNETMVLIRLMCEKKGKIFVYNFATQVDRPAMNLLNDAIEAKRKRGPVCNGFKRDLAERALYIVRIVDDWEDRLAKYEPPDEGG